MQQISPELLAIIKKRIEAMPSDIKVVVLDTILTKTDIIKEIESGSPLGQKLLELEVKYYYDLIRR